MVVPVVKADTAGGFRATANAPGYSLHPETIHVAGHRKVGVVVEGCCNTRFDSYPSVEPICNNWSPHFQDHRA